jgi:hypothetical protein
MWIAQGGKNGTSASLIPLLPAQACIRYPCTIGNCRPQASTHEAGGGRSPFHSCKTPTPIGTSPTRDRNMTGSTESREHFWRLK